VKWNGTIAIKTMDINGWSNQIESIIQQIADKSYEMSNRHKQNYIDISDKLKYFRIPIIVLSGINSVASVGLQSYTSQDNISALTCVLALVCGIIGSIELFLKLSESLQIEYVSGKEFSLLHIDCSKMLMLSREERSISGSDYLNDIFGRYTTLIGNSQIIIGDILKHGNIRKPPPSPKPSLIDTIKKKISPSSPSPSINGSEVELVVIDKCNN